jgi:TonB family protein
MNSSTVLRIPLLALSVVGMSAHAEWRCDCTTILDTCNATVTVENDWVSIESDHLQCARVDYLIDGLPFVALVVEGRERQSWLNRSDDPRVLMQSCRVCLDNAEGEAPAAMPVGPTLEREQPSEAELSPLISVEPKYPSAAASSRVEGFVEVDFMVTALGEVQNASISAAEPPGVFDQAALAAISRWRYSAVEVRETATLSHRFDFRSEDAIAASAAPAAETVIDALIARSAPPEPVPAAPVVRNHCIREQLSYDFGEMVDASLMNVCSEPLMVYSCAEGMGRYRSHWVCQSTENAQRILVRPGDRLAGNVALIDVPEGQRTFRYAEDLLVARTRRSSYWWLACDVDDAECRGSGRQWARSMNGKPLSVDPQLWTEQSVASSD